MCLRFWIVSKYYQIFANVCACWYVRSFPAVDANANVRKLFHPLPQPPARLQGIQMWLRHCVFEFVPIYWHIITSGTMKALTMHKERSGRSLIYQ